MSFNTVYILGAGASKHSGLPLLNNFFQHAYSVRGKNRCNQNAPNGYASFLEIVDEFRTQLKAEKSSVNVHNLEEVYAEALKKDSAKLVEALNRVIEGVLDLGGCSVRYQGQQYHPEQYYSKFVQGHLLNKPSSVITFNWDCLLDYALFYHDWIPDYCLNQGNSRNDPAKKLIKIHGSINWGRCNSCGHGPHPIIPNGEIGTRPGVIRRRNVDFDLRLITEILARKSCPKCQSGRFTPIIIPPSQEKTFSDLMGGLVAEAKLLIQNAEFLFFIGYSFPETDKYFIQFIQDALIGNIRLREVYVINPDSELKSRYERNLAAKRHSLTVQMIPKTFEQYLITGIH